MVRVRDSEPLDAIHLDAELPQRNVPRGRLLPLISAKR